jgi:protein-disulfide isomerase
MPLLLLFAALLAAAPDRPSGELSNDRAREILPRAELSQLSDAQRAQFLEIAGDTFDYAGCNDTLAQCLRAGVKDHHALRMTELIKYMLLEGYTPSVIIDFVERYYASFPESKRQKLRDDDCPQLGDAKARVVVVEFSDFQCPHCATASKPLRDLVAAMPGRVRLCSKYFPLPGHPRAQQAAAAAEYAFRHRKFWEMSELLFAHQDNDELDDAHLREYARELGLDGNEMLKQIYAGKLDAAIERHKKEGVDAGVRATPTLFFNGRQFILPLKPEFLVFSAQDEEEWQKNKGAWEKE